MEYLFIYGLQMANYLMFIAICLLILVPLIIATTAIIFSYDDNNLKQNWNNWMKKTLITSLITSLILLALPTKQTLLLMGGTYLGKKTVNEVVQSDKMEKINTIIDLQLDKYIKDLQGATK